MVLFCRWDYHHKENEEFPGIPGIQRKIFLIMEQLSGSDLKPSVLKLLQPNQKTNCPCEKKLPKFHFPSCKQYGPDNRINH